MATQVVYQQDSDEECKLASTIKSWVKEGPHEGFFGMIYANSIWNIVRNALFGSQWWAGLVSGILGIILVVEFIKFIANANKWTSHPYDTDFGDIVGLAIAIFVVNIVMGSLFSGQWWAQIPIVVLNIAMAETVFELIMTIISKNNNKEVKQQVPAQMPQAQQAKIEPIQSVQAVSCPMCGIEKSSTAKFCIGCGHQF